MGTNKIKLTPAVWHKIQEGPLDEDSVDEMAETYAMEMSGLGVFVRILFFENSDAGKPTDTFTYFIKGGRILKTRDSYIVTSASKKKELMGSN